MREGRREQGHEEATGRRREGRSTVWGWECSRQKEPGTERRHQRMGRTADKRAATAWRARGEDASDRAGPKRQNHRSRRRERSRKNKTNKKSSVTGEKR